MPIYIKDPAQPAAEQVGKAYMKDPAQSSAEEVGALYIGRVLAFRHPNLPDLSSVALAVRDASSAIIAPDATGTEGGVVVQSYRETSWARARDVRITGAYSGVTSPIRCRRRTPGRADVNIPVTTSSTTQAVFDELISAVPLVSPLARHDYQVSVGNLEGIVKGHIDLQQWITPTASIMQTNNETTTGDPPIAAHQLHLTITRGGNPLPSGADGLSLTGSDGHDVLDAARAFRYTDAASVTISLTRVVTNSPRTVTYRFTTSNIVPGGARLTATASLDFTWP